MTFQKLGQKGILAVGCFKPRTELKKIGKIISETEIEVSYYGKRRIGTKFVVRKTSGHDIVICYYNGFWSQTGTTRDKFKETTAVLAVGNDLKTWSEVPYEVQKGVIDDGQWFRSFI